MKASSLVVLVSTAAVASSSSILARDAMPFMQVLNSITANITNVDVQINAYTSDKGPVFTAFNSLLQAMNDGTKTINAQPDLSTSDAASLVDPLSTLNDDSMKLNNDLKSKRDVVEKNSACSDVRTALDQVNTAASDLIKAAVSKVPKGFQNIAQSSSQNFTDTFKQTSDYFSTTNCKDGGSSGSSASPSASASGSGSTASQTSGSGSSGSATASAASPTKTNAAAEMQVAGALAVAMAAFLV